MTMRFWVELVVRAFEFYLAFGLAFAVWFQALGWTRIDASAAGGGIGFRLLITPGLVLLWPLLLMKWWRHNHHLVFLGDPIGPVSPRRLRRCHGLIWKGLAVLVPLLIGSGWWWRLTPPSPSVLPELPVSVAIKPLAPR